MLALRFALLHLAGVVLFFVLLGGLLFACAGRLDWYDAWLFLAVYCAIALGAAVWTARRDPALLLERDTALTKKNVKPWDRVLVALNALLTVLLFAVIALDAGRFRLSEVPPLLRALAVLVVLAAFALSTWASQVNTYMSAQVRIQEERGHRVIDRGPYAYLRHPMYVGMCLTPVAFPLALGSWWALGVGAMMIVAVVVRTALEDRTLQAELPGYAEYAARVRYRLLPGVW